MSFYNHAWQTWKKTQGEKTTLSLQPIYRGWCGINWAFKFHIRLGEDSSRAGSEETAVRLLPTDPFTSPAVGNMLGGVCVCAHKGHARGVSRQHYGPLGSLRRLLLGMFPGLSNLHQGLGAAQDEEGAKVAYTYLAPLSPQDWEFCAVLVKKCHTDSHP